MTQQSMVTTASAPIIRISHPQKLPISKISLQWRHMSVMASQISSWTIRSIPCSPDNKKDMMSPMIGPLWGEFTSDLWIPHTRASKAESGPPSWRQHTGATQAKSPILMFWLSMKLQSVCFEKLVCICVESVKTPFKIAPKLVKNFFEWESLYYGGGNQNSNSAYHHWSLRTFTK